VGFAVIVVSSGFVGYFMVVCGGFMVVSGGRFALCSGFLNFFFLQVIVVFLVIIHGCREI
jgi:hypothetical protein